MIEDRNCAMEYEDKKCPVDCAYLLKVHGSCALMHVTKSMCGQGG